ncbi:hypothetical protein [Curtobacterium sp. MCBD17_040]|uniref:hypothetical protein n=1 Tax=Curtobacterium sp. MCBD17_040 TaxID=2175674 RepID=UPI0011B7BB11|nr:hypothetical protein [Curtobacterium sp. MCBD17_040]WIB65473.1 hypothetical protein DEI94_19055 [Curtobacterium sp. MCBD17_040]
MNRIVTAAAFSLVLAASLTGCSSSGHSETAHARSVASSSPTPTPTAASIADAGKYFLATLCPVNKASATLNDALTAQNLAAIQSSAKALLAPAQNTARRLDDGAFEWPSVVDQKDVTSLRNYYLSALGPINQLATAPNLDEANAVVFPSDTDSGPASQRIRLRLNLSANTSEGC